MWFDQMGSQLRIVYQILFTQRAHLITSKFIGQVTNLASARVVTFGYFFVSIINRVNMKLFLKWMVMILSVKAGCRELAEDSLELETENPVEVDIEERLLHCRLPGHT